MLLHASYLLLKMSRPKNNFFSFASSSIAPHLSSCKFCAALHSAGLVARWDAVWFMNHLIKLIRFSYLLSWFFLTNETKSTNTNSFSHCTRNYDQNLKVIKQNKTKNGRNNPQQRIQTRNYHCKWCLNLLEAKEKRDPGVIRSQLF